MCISEWMAEFAELRGRFAGELGGAEAVEALSEKQAFRNLLAKVGGQLLMKLVQLNMRAYGPFTNKVVDFGGPADEASGNPGLHIVLGANEAGKSTALRALRAVLFGMNDMRDAHLHPKDMLRVGLKVTDSETARS